MKPPDPLPATLPGGTTAEDGRYVARGEVKLTTPPSMPGYWGGWVRVPYSVAQNIIMEIGEIDWPEEGSAPAERRSAEETMSDSPDPEEPEMTFEARITTAIEKLTGWPLDKSETFAAFALMGLTSRLQPLQVNSTEQQMLVVDLALKLGELAAQKSPAK